MNIATVKAFQLDCLEIAVHALETSNLKDPLVHSARVKLRQVQEKLRKQEPPLLSLAQAYSDDSDTGPAGLGELRMGAGEAK